MESSDRPRPDGWMRRSHREITAEVEPQSDDRELLLRLRAASRTRRARWHGEDSTPWSGADWSNAMCGEAGEAANVVKKLRRSETNALRDGDPGVLHLLDMLAEELADTVIYLDLLADHYGINLVQAIEEKFDATSERMGFPERLGVAAP